MKFTTRFQCFLLLSAVYWSPAAGSPTSNEFEACHRAASTILLKCLDASPGYPDDACWTEARSANESCYSLVVDRHRKPDAERIEAERKARESYRQQLERRMADEKK